MLWFMHHVKAGLLTEAQRRDILGEVADVFAASIRDKRSHSLVVKMLGACWGVPETGNFLTARLLRI